MIFVPACLMLAIALAGPAAYPLASAAGGVAGSLPGASLDPSAWWVIFVAMLMSAFPVRASLRRRPRRR